MNPSERAYLRTLMRKRDEYLRAREQEYIVPLRPPCLMGYDCAYQVALFLENLANEWRHHGPR